MTSLCVLFPSMSFGVDLKFYGFIIFIKIIMSTLILLLRIFPINIIINNRADIKQHVQILYLN